MDSVSLLIKPVSGLCNMRCGYCFYRNVAANRSVPHMGRMSLDTARRVIEGAFRAAGRGGLVTFMFQGGEPTLAGLDFFRGFAQLEREYAPPGVHVEHAIQTNGLLLNGDWSAFLGEHSYLVGLSLDGTQMIHDRFRVDEGGMGTWERTVSALRLLESHRVETNLLCVVTAQIAAKPQRVYRSLAGLGGHPLQFIPCLEPLGSGRGTLAHSLNPEAYGRFLCGLFDRWYRDWRSGRYVTIRAFEDYLRLLMGMPPTSCAASGSCGHYLVVEADGGLYPCDFYAVDQWRLGSILHCSVQDALAAPAAVEFLREGGRRAEECRLCRYLPLCRGGCRRDRLDNGSNYYCAAYRAFFPYALSRLEEMAAFYLGNH